MAAGINKIDDVYDTEWYREHVVKAERGNREHVARYERGFNGVMAKSLADDEPDDPIRAPVSDHHASKVADLLVEAGSHPDRSAALSYLLHSSHGAALLSRLHKAAEQTEKETPPMTSHSEFVQSVVKRYGIVALAKSMVQDQKSYGVDELSFTRLATDHAQRVYPNDRPDVAFSKLYQSEESVRRACNVLKSMPFIADLTPLVVGGFTAQNEANDNTESSEAYAQLQQIGRDRWPTASEAQQFAYAFADPANAALALKAHRRPTAPAGGVYPYPLN